MLRSSALALLATAACAAEPASRALSLRETVQGSASSTGVRLSELAEQAARAGTTIERAALLPSLAAVGTVTRSASAISMGEDDAPETTAPRNSFDARLRLGQALLDVAAWYRTDAAIEQARTAIADRQVALEAAAQGAASGYVNLLRSRALVEVRKRDLALAEELSTLAEAQVKAGVAEPISGTRAQTQVAIAKGNLLVAENGAAQAQIDLARVLALDSGLSIQTTSAFDQALCVTTAPVEPEAAIALALRDRAELRSLAAARLGAQLQIDAIRGERLGNAQLFADGGRSGWSKTATSWDIGVQYTLPLFDGLRREGRIDVQAAAIRQAEVRSTDLKDQIAAEVRTAIINLGSANQVLTVAQERVRLAEQELGQARDRFRVGVASNLDVITAQQGLSLASELEVNARAGAAVNRAGLARAVGAATELR